MTKEECIEILDKFAHHSHSEVIEYPRKVAIEAFEMAIAALKAEPCEDAVSRQAVLELVADYDLSMGQVVKGIHALPSVTLKQKVRNKE